MLNIHSLRNLLREIWDKRTQMAPDEREVFRAGWLALCTTLTGQHRLSALLDGLTELAHRSPVLTAAKYPEYIQKKLVAALPRIIEPTEEPAQQHRDSLIGYEAYEELRRLWEVEAPAPPAPYGSAAPEPQ